MNVALSVVILTFNEEKNIERCLQSVVSLADDIVVVDSFSSDATESLCKKFEKVRFIQHPFEGYIEQKNWAITQARYPHILSLDADEALCERLQKNIQQVKENWQAEGYYFNRLTNYCGKWIRHCGWYPDQKLRLWDSRKGKWTGINPHDCFELQTGSTSLYLQGDILHYSYYSIQQHIAQVNRFSDIGAKEYFERHKKAGFTGLVLKPFWKFCRDYFFKLGFLDGYYGFVICMVSAFATFAKYLKLNELYKNK